MVGVELSKEKSKARAALKWFALNCANDVLILGGASVCVYATFRVNTTAGFYALGAAMVAVGWYLTQNPMKGE